MPSFTSSEHFLAGFITAKEGDLVCILNVLASPAVLSDAEMHNMRGRINDNDASIRSQHRAIYDARLRPKLTRYEKQLNLAIVELDRREKHRGQRPPESEAMRARRLRLNDNLDAYASDGGGPAALEDWTVVNPAPQPAPVSAEALRRALEDRRSGRDREFRRNESPTRDVQRYAVTGLDSQPIIRSVCVRPGPRVDEDEAGPSGMQHIADTPRSPSPEIMDTDDDDASTGGRRTRDVSPVSYRSRSSIATQGSNATYVSTQQQKFTKPRFDMPLPKFRDSIQHPIDPNDPDIVGQSEFYARRQGNGCPFCGDDHRGIKCPEYKKQSLQARWYHALNMGVCLNCLRWGHSSFRCFAEGACKRCGVRHNSLLCPHRAPDHRRR